MQRSGGFVEFHLLESMKFRRRLPSAVGLGKGKFESRLVAYRRKDSDPTLYHRYLSRVTLPVNVEARAQVLNQGTAAEDVKWSAFVFSDYEGCFAGHELNVAGASIEGGISGGGRVATGFLSCRRAGAPANALIYGSAAVPSRRLQRKACVCPQAGSQRESRS